MEFRRVLFRSTLKSTVCAEGCNIVKEVKVKALRVLTFTSLTMLQAFAQTVDFKVCRHFGEGQGESAGILAKVEPDLSFRSQGNHPTTSPRNSHSYRSDTTGSTLEARRAGT